MFINFDDKIMNDDKIPVIVGVTGHRNIVPEDYPALKAQVAAALNEVKEICGAGTPVVMLNAFAEGGDMLCAEVAFDMGIDVYALLPCPAERYVKSFDDKLTAEKLPGCLAKAKRVMVAPDAEENKGWIKQQISELDDESYEYRQLGISMASNSHILIALWDGKPPKTPFGCGTAEVIKFALEQNYLSREHLFQPGSINESAVIWIKARRMGDEATDTGRKWLASKYYHMDGGESYGDYKVFDRPPRYIRGVIARTAEYNSESADISEDRVRLWKDVEQLDDYRKALRRHYIRADGLSYSKNQKKYSALLLAIACLGTLVALFFMLYDDAAIRYMIYLCTVALCALICVTAYGRRRGVHRKYVEYRALAEAIRIQFYSSMCIDDADYNDCVCDLCSWTQKADMCWISKAIKAIWVVNDTQKLNTDASAVMNVWIGKNIEPRGQLRYHSDKIDKNRRFATLYGRLSKAIKLITVAIYFVIFVMELVTAILNATGSHWFWEGALSGEVGWRSLGVIIVGTATAASLLFSSYFGKLSYDRKANDNENMIALYSSACARWNDVKGRPAAEVKKFVREVAREEIVENGIWCSYVLENGLEIEL